MGYYTTVQKGEFLTMTKQRGDRKDGHLVHSDDPMHIFMPYIMGSRTDNEALLNATFDMTAVTEYLKKKNEQNQQFKYTIFHVVIAALAKTIYLRPKMNIFIAGHRHYQRDEISFCFTARNKMVDNGGEFVMYLVAEDGNNLIEQIHDKICSEVYKTRTESEKGNQTNGTDKMMSIFNKIPRPILRLVIRFLNWMVYHDILPDAIRAVDPYRATVLISNLGSIKMEASYHHLINWSLNSIFVLANRMHKMPFFNDDGTYEMKDGMSFGFTIDERIADGFYFAKSLALFKNILAYPECLDEPLSASFDKYVKEEDWFN
jgi:hypothetical protein